MARDLKLLFKVRPSLPDNRDYVYERSDKPLRDAVDLREWASLVEDQSQLGSCSGNAVANAYELLVKKEKPDIFVELSRLFIYYNTRLLEGSLGTDAGATLRGSMKAAEKFGLCKESLWPYHIDEFDTKPTEECYADAKHRTIKNYQRIANVGDMLDALNNEKPVVFGVDVFEGFMYLNKDESTVYVPMYRSESLGAHAMSMEGYDLSKGVFLAKNSFGTNWGDQGYCWIPFEYISLYGFDMWIFDIVDISERTVLLSAQ